MNAFSFPFADAMLHALGSGALFWPEEALLVVSDLHLGKSERMARRSRQLLPPYETRDTLQRMNEAIKTTQPKTVVCLGDSFDDLQAGEALPPEDVDALTTLMAGRKWIWIEGNHDPGPLSFGGAHLAEYEANGITFRHIATADGKAEVSGHFHPKVSLLVRGRLVSRRSFLVCENRLIMPAFGTYTGGLRSSDSALDALMGPDAYAIMTGPKPHAVPMPRGEVALR